MVKPKWTPPLSFLLIASSLLSLLNSCSLSPTPEKQHHSFPGSSYLHTRDGLSLGIRCWSHQQNPKTVVIALHGIEGASWDYRGLGKHLREHRPDVALYALNLRGNGYDPRTSERGNIDSIQNWFNDLHDLNEALRNQFPNTPVVWLGESMGAAIAVNAAAQTILPPDALILSSPVVSLSIATPWQQKLLAVSSSIAPGFRVSLEDLAGDNFQADEDNKHFAQSSTNRYHIPAYTLRYLSSLGKIIERSHPAAPEYSGPVLILHGSKDPLANPEDVLAFANKFPGPVRTAFFSDSEHLLYYDSQRKKVFTEITTYLP